jgi:hypothetical protein
MWDLQVLRRRVISYLYTVDNRFDIPLSPRPGLDASSARDFLKRG